MIGTQIDNYRILEKIGDGGMGSVYRAVDVMLEREVALKFLRPELASQPDLVDRFRSEAIVLAKLHHPNIASLYGLHKHGDDFFMAMEYVRGETLDASIRHAKQLPIQQASEVASAVLGALEYAHTQGIVHRDIKSANIILGSTGVKVMDFGIARVLGTDRRTRVGFVVGTIGYMAPEQIQGMDVDGRADIYALGVVLYEMITGRVPFEGESEWAVMQAQVQQMPVPPRVFASNIPVSLENTVMRALAKHAQDRFQSAVEFQRAIQGALRQSGFHQTTSFVAMPPETLIAAPGDETREHKSNPHLASGEVPIGSGAFVVPPPPPVTGSQPAPGGPQAAGLSSAPAHPVPAAAIPTPSPAAVGAVAAGKAKAPPAKAPGARGNGLAFAVVGLVAVIAIGGGVAAWRVWKARTAAAPVAETTTTPAEAGAVDLAAIPPEPSLPAPAAAPPSAAPVPPGAPPPAATSAGTPRPAGTATTATTPKAPPARPTARTTIPAVPLVVEQPPVVTTPARPDLPNGVFGGVRVVTRPGRRAQETSAVLELRNDELRVRPLGNPERVVGFSTISGAWFGTLRIDRLVGGDTRHLLFLTVSGEPFVLRLDRANFRTILAAFEARGVHIDNRGDITLEDVER